VPDTLPKVERPLLATTRPWRHPLRSQGKTFPELDVSRAGRTGDDVVGKLFRRVASHKQAVADFQARIHDAIGPVGRLRDTGARGRVGVAHHHQDFAAQHPFVKLEGRFALTVEAQIGDKVGGHDTGPFLVRN
jgi:hypothetical protein